MIYTQKGIRFNILEVARLYPGVSPPDVCPEDASMAVPLELYRVYQNEHGAIFQTTNWDFGEFNSPTPEALENSPSGTYICLGQSVTVVPNFVILGGVGRYRCAVTHPLVSTAPAEDIQDYFEYVAPQVDGLPVISMGASYASGGAFISADIPETCDEEGTENRNRALPATINILGTTFVLPPTQSD